MKKEQLSDSISEQTNVLSNTIIALAAAGVAIFLVVFVRKRRRQSSDS